MRVAIHHHQAKAQPFARALAEAGHELTGLPADVVLLDADFPAYREVIGAAVAGGAKVYLYPHGQPIGLAHDGIYNPDPRVSGQFVTGSGAAEILRRIGYPGEIHQVGWFSCPILPFRGAGAVGKVLFAPIHPMPDRGLEQWMTLNAEVFAALLELADVELTVRHIGPLEHNGLHEAPGVRFTESRPDNTYEQIDEADVVVAGWGTFPCLAIARGCPTVMYAGDVPASNLENAHELRHAANWHRYHSLLRYPLDFADAPLRELLHTAAAGDAPIRQWREHFIGSEWDPARFAARLERAVRGPSLQARDFVTVASAVELEHRPELLASYARAFGVGDDATLVLRAPGASPAEVIERLERAGVALEGIPDVVLETGEDSDDMVAGRAAAVYGRSPVAPALADLPRFDVDTIAELRARADDRWNAREARGAGPGG